MRNQVRMARLRLGLSQQELAEQAGVTRQAISAIEGGLYIPSTAVALQLARALRCRVDELFWLEEEASGELEARAAQALPAGREVPVLLARVGDAWVAHPLLAPHRPGDWLPADGWAERPPGSTTVRVRLGEDVGALAKTVVVAGCAPALALWARAAERQHPDLRAHCLPANSLAALAMLARGEVHAAGLHLYDEATGEHNAPFVAAQGLAQTVALVNLGVWREGLLLRPGLGQAVREAPDLVRLGLRLINREPGAGARLLLERFLRDGGVPGEAVPGFTDVVHGHVEVAQAIAAGRADVGVSTEALARLFGLDFIPLQQVRYDVAVLEPYLEEPPVRQLLALLTQRGLRAQLARLGGYETGLTGEVVSRVLPSARS